MSACMQGDDRSFGAGESARDAGPGTLFTVFQGEHTVYVLVVSAGTLHGCQDDSTLQIGGPHTDGLE